MSKLHTNCLSMRVRSYWIPGSYAPTLSEKHNSFLRPLKKKGFKDKRVTTIGLYDIGKSTTLESNKSHPHCRRGNPPCADRRRDCRYLRALAALREGLLLTPVCP